MNAKKIKPNYSGFVATFLQKSSSNVIDGNFVIAIFYVDINALDDINIDHGRAAGDFVIQEVLRVLKENLGGLVRPSIFFELIHLAEDEFAIACKLKLEPEWCWVSREDRCPPASIVCSRLSSILSKSISNHSFIFASKAIKVSVSIGAATMEYERNHVINTKEVIPLIRMSKRASIDARYSGFEQVLILDLNDVLQKRRKSLAVSKIRKSIVEDKIGVHFQPIIDSRTNSVVRIEALVRIISEKHGELISPGDFIPLILDNDIIGELGLIVFSKVLEALSTWRGQGKRYKVSVNVSARQLQDRNFAPHLLKLLLKFPSVHSSQLHIEILESGEIVDFETVIMNLEALRRAEIQCCLDDFGTGSASFAYLKRLPVTCLKIDQLFTSAILHNSKDEAIVKSCISIAEAFGVDVVAEGVETLEVANKLNTLGCFILQGFLISRPLSQKDFDLWIENFSKTNHVFMRHYNDNVA